MCIVSVYLLLPCQALYMEVVKLRFFVNMNMLLIADNIAIIQIIELNKVFWVDICCRDFIQRLSTSLVANTNWSLLYLDLSGNVIEDKGIYFSVKVEQSINSCESCKSVIVIYLSYCLV